MDVVIVPDDQGLLLIVPRTAITEQKSSNY